ncbi:MAG: hypothetical protein JWO36_1340 [Myxococcales bacterium]|nr:hypothetical protein [Myxococcales bacterium]
MRQLLWLATFVALPAPPAFARDSLWLLCTGTGVEQSKAANAGDPPVPSKHGMVISLFDQRYKAVQRLDSLLVLFGARRFDAQLVDFELVFNQKTKPMALELKEGTKTMFKGQIRASLTDSGSTLSLNGKMRDGYDVSAEFVSFEGTFTCKDMAQYGED